eukprot:79092-Rhodomonas_salina.1
MAYIMPVREHARDTLVRLYAWPTLSQYRDTNGIRYPSTDTRVADAMPVRGHAWHRLCQYGYLEGQQRIREKHAVVMQDNRHVIKLWYPHTQHQYCTITAT